MHIFAFGTGEQVMMIHLLRTARVVFVALAGASCGSNNSIAGPADRSILHAVFHDGVAERHLAVSGEDRMV
jgi:hypothetical protein